MSAININQSNFQNEVMNYDKPVLLDFWAPWCGPCRMVVPIVEEIARERSDIKVGKINVDENPELAGQFGVMSIPITQLHQFVENRDSYDGHSQSYHRSYKTFDSEDTYRVEDTNTYTFRSNDTGIHLYV